MRPGSRRVLQLALLILPAVTAPSARPPSKECPTGAGWSASRSMHGLRLFQVRASPLYQTQVIFAQKEEEAAVAIGSERDQRAGDAARATGDAGEAAAASQVGSVSIAGSNGSDAHPSEPVEDDSDLVRSVNTTLKDWIDEAESRTLTNETVAERGAKALDRKVRGKKTRKEKKFVKAVRDDQNETIEDELKNRTIRRAIREAVEEAVDAEVVRKLRLEKRLPNRHELAKTVEDELESVWEDLINARRHSQGFEADVSLWSSVAFFDWCLCLGALAMFIGVHRLLCDWPTAYSCHACALLVWLAMGGLYNFFIYLRLGGEPAVNWLIGYLLELIFTIDNIFVYHIIVKAFRVPRPITQRVLFIVLQFQIVFQLIFYMGLGKWLQSLQVLPYLIGAWLIYLGCQAVLEEDLEDFDIMKTPAVAWLKWLLGERLAEEPDGKGELLCATGGKTRLTPPGLLLLCLLAADFLLEVDVTVTKIEGYPSRYLCFSSSMVASFMLPELFFVARDLFQRFFALKYGIGIVLLFVGVQALLHNVFTLTAVVNLAIIIGVMLLSIAVSALCGLGKGFIGTDISRPHEVQ